MKKDVIAKVLEAEGCKPQGGAHLLPEEREASAFVRTGGDPLTLVRVTRIELHAEHVGLENARGERFFFAYDDLLGLRLNKLSAERAAGFGR